MQTQIYFDASNPGPVDLGIGPGVYLFTLVGKGNFANFDEENAGAAALVFSGGFGLDGPEAPGGVFQSLSFLAPANTGNLISYDIKSSFVAQVMAPRLTARLEISETVSDTVVGAVTLYFFAEKIG